MSFETEFDPSSGRYRGFSDTDGTSTSHAPPLGTLEEELRRTGEYVGEPSAKEEARRSRESLLGAMVFIAGFCLVADSHPDFQALLCILCAFSCILVPFYFMPSGWDNFGDHLIHDRYHEQQIRKSQRFIRFLLLFVALGGVMLVKDNIPTMEMELWRILSHLLFLAFGVVCLYTSQHYAALTQAALDKAG